MIVLKNILLIYFFILTTTVDNSYSASVSVNNGTKLTAVTDAATIQCVDNDSALVEFTTTVTSSGAVDSAEIKTVLDGNDPFISGWIEPQDFIHNGRFKTAVVPFSQVLDNGVHTVFSCYEQSGADGRLLKRVCTTPKTFEINCAPIDPCAGVEVFGNIIGNGNLCSGAAIPIHIKGSFGDGGSLIINKGSFSTTIRVDRSGDSCVYQGQYRPGTDGNGGAGAYTFTLIGDNNAAYSFSANLKCK